MFCIRLSILLSFLLTSLSANAQDYQLSTTNDMNGLYDFMGQSVFSQGVAVFLKDIFNMPAYGQDFLPNNFYHIGELLSYGNKANKDYVYIRSVLRLFSNKLKTASYINAYAFSDLLHQLPMYLERYCKIESDQIINSLQDVIYHIQYQTFLVQFPEFKANPDTFLKKMSTELEDITEVRRLLITFLEIGLSKLIWSPQDQVETWKNAKEIANHLESLYKINALTNLEDLNDLYITLLERYCFFLDVAGSQIEIKTFEDIKDDIENNPIPWLELEEQEIYLETKSDRLIRCLIELEAKARARDIGLIV